ncbi:MAG: hypothetical protein A2309_04110, partial [Bacteroidetes bacterium RIFOXYB2_FULL_35_7]
MFIHYIYISKKYWQKFFIYFFVSIISSLIIFSCQNNTTNNNEIFEKEIPNCYAKGFSIMKNKTYTKVSVINPWQGAQKISFDFFLVPKNSSMPETIKKNNVIRTPVSKIICLSTTHASMVNLIGETASIAGMAGTDYIVSPELRKLISEKKIKDVGYDNNLNYEIILSLKPDLVIIYGIGSEAMQIMTKLNDLKIPSVINAEYLEENVLAKVEWLKFISLFYEKENIAEKIFLEIENEYKQLKQKVADIETKPKIINGLPWKGIWWVAGGKSYMAQLIYDAGGDYLWKENNSRESLPLNLENIIMKSSEADIWINCGAANSKKEILSVDERIADLKFFQKDIYNNNAIQNEFGGNDFWESGVVNPHLILKDLIFIFHPELLPGHKLK